ncbi:HEAT repeat domain-containing protein [Botrimarina sp.]|uniref:HEAT repeat domain-containing protein n=1 Tax=Botrimarina sp. TaxID=2795802 RepID=UPI0032EFD64C
MHHTRFFLGLALSAASGVLVAPPCHAQDASAAVSAATSKSGDEQFAAIDRLGRLRESSTEAVPALQKLLQSSEARVQWRSARALGHHGKAAADAAPRLRELLKEGKPAVRYHAAVALGKIGSDDDATIDALVAAATGADATVARAAIAALRNIGPPPARVVDAFQQALASDHDSVVVYALEALVERGADATPVLREALKRGETAYVACAAIEQIGEPVASLAPEVAALLSDTKHSHLQVQALLALASVGPSAKDTSDKILPVLKQANDPSVAAAAAYALGSVGATNADDALKAAADRDDPLLSMVAAWALATVHPDDADLQAMARQRLQSGAQSDDPTIRAAAEKGLTLLGADKG